MNKPKRGSFGSKFDAIAAIGAFKKIAPASFWPFLGSLGIATALVIMTFYSVIAGWFMPKPMLEQQLTNRNTVNKKSCRFFYIMIRFVSPIMLALLFPHISGII